MLEIKIKCQVDKCPSIINLGQTISDLLGHILEKYTCATVDVHQQIMKAKVDILNTNDLVTSLCVCVCM